MDNIRAQPVRVVVHAARENGVEDVDQLAAYRHDSLLTLERILLLGRVIVIHLPKLIVAPYQRQNRLEQDLPQILPSTLADGRLALVLAGAVLLEFQPGQLLNLLRRVKTSDVAYLREETCYRDETYSLDGEQLLNVRHFQRFRFQYLVFVTAGSFCFHLAVFVLRLF